MKLFFDGLRTEFEGYNLKKLKKDALSGITVTAVALPLALAFGIGSGATAQSGLITAIISGFVIGILSGGSFQISGPTGAMAAILVSLVAKYGLNGIFIACLLSGIFLVFAGVLKLGKIVSIIPTHVITGFTSGIALLIFIGQLDNFFGIQALGGESALFKLLYYFKTGISPNWWAVIIGGAAIAIIIAYPKKWNGFIPSSLAALIAQGVGNIIIPFFGGIPATAAIARTSVGIKSGGQTRLVSVFHGVGLLISMLILAPVMARIPMSALAGVLMVTAFRMNEWAMIKFAFSKKFKSAIAKFLITMLATVIFDLTIAILIGTIFACVLFIHQISSNTEVNIDSIRH